MQKLAVIIRPGADAPSRTKLDLHSDGTLWTGKNPVCVIRHLPDYTDIKAKYDAALKQGNLGCVVDPAHIARLGENPGGVTIEWAETYDTRQRAEYAVNVARQRVIELRQIRVHIASCGWGDYKPVEWMGDATTPTAQIVAAALKMQESADDVDTLRSANEIVALVEAAKAEWRTNINEQIKALSDWLSNNPRSSLPDAASARRRAREYNEMMNEGGDGYVPDFPCREEWDTKREELDNLQAIIKG